MAIADFRGQATHEFMRDPAVVTLYGRTVVPAHVHLVKQVAGGTPFPGEPIKFTAAALMGGGAVTFNCGADVSPEMDGTPKVE